MDGQEYGWEQIDDNQSGDYGFNWDRKINYIFPYNLGEDNIFKDYHYTESEARELINSIIQQYNAESYTSIVNYSIWPSNRVYVAIDYSNLNSLLGKASSSDDGLQNTKELNEIAGSAFGAFELALENTYKTESGHETEHMFRVPNTSAEKNIIPEASGTNNPKSGILGFVLKKNKYNLPEIKDDNNIGYAPILTEVVWYLPAYGQFTSLPEGMTSSDYWSSTATNESAYLGSGTEAADGDGRGETHYVRAMRNKPTE